MIVAGAAMLMLVLSTATGIAYVWQPPEDRDYQSRYLTTVESRYADTDLARFHYTKTGTGPAVVLVAGGGQWLYSYRDTIPVLAQHFTVYAVDLPGQGYTTLKQRDFRYDLDAMSGALGTFLDAMALPKASLVGHSWGGATSLYFAERHPERVTRLALLASPGLDVPSSWDWRPLEVPVLGELIGKLMTKSNSEATQRKSFVHQDRVTPELIDENWAQMSRPDNREALWSQQRNFDYALTERLLGEVGAPTLVVWGGADRFDEPWQAAELARRIPRATSQVFEGCGHSVHEDCADQVNPALLSFLTV
ncbi:alpha/beta hydrolase [Nocardia sp. NPDC023852]|uniref:alpha/beta fold hydrolase n=1 Tax=Nocardia sp. NPDC023852 TaxID=3154697 RepID=UPI003404F7BA